MKKESEGIKHLNSLIHLDIDAVQAYTQAIDNIEVPEVQERLAQFRGDHERHITDLSAVVRDLGGEPPARKADVKGFFIEKFTAIRSMTGTEGALKAMKGNEELTNRTYQKALTQELPERAVAIVRRNYADEQRHLQYIEQVLEQRVWVRPQKKAV